jgi:hypothetical protein
MTPLTVACVFVRGEYPYTVEYVERLYAMVRRWLDRPFRFVCLTDQPEAMPPGVEAIPIATLPECFAYWAKLELFNPRRAWPGRVLYLDLDTLVVAPLAPLVDFDALFALTADPPREGQKSTDRYGRQIVRRFNSSVMVWDGGTQTSLYTDWRPSVAARLSGDQCWIGEHAPSAVGMPRRWFPRLSEVTGPPFDPHVKVVLSKHPKNHVAVASRPWFAPLWGAA